MIHNDLLLILLIFEWWLGAQKWINAKSTVALIILIIGTVAYFISRRKNGSSK